MLQEIGALRGEIAELRADVGGIAEVVDGIDLRLPEDELYCPLETPASYLKRRGGVVAGDPDTVLCPGGFRLGRPTKWRTGTRNGGATGSPTSCPTGGAST